MSAPIESEFEGSPSSPRERALERRIASGLATLFGPLERSDTVQVGVSIAASRFAGRRGSLDVPPHVRGCAETALVSGVARLVRHAGRSWVAAAVRRPYPALIAVRGSGRAAVDAAKDAAARLTRTLLPELARGDPFLPVVASAPALLPAVRSLERIARAPLPVLVVGETGTGKDVLARAVHAASGRSGPFVAENCAAFPEALLEAELFGVRRGAFTGADRDRKGRLEEADGGTLFLDEIGDLPPPLQAKLLRVLQDREFRPLGGGRPVRVDLRVVSATHRTLPRRMETGDFRSDLYFRLAGFVCDVPPLRERRTDLPYLTAALLARLEDEGIGPGRHLDGDATRRLYSTDYRGNVRELDNVLRRAAALSRSATITIDVVQGGGAIRHGHDNLEWRMIQDALRLAGGVKAEAARRLGWSRQKLYRRLTALESAPGATKHPGP